MTHDHVLERAFHPKAIAIVGVSRAEGDHPPGYTGLSFLRLLQKAGFEGRVYPINPKATVIEDVKAYPSVKSVPEALDLVIVAVPAVLVPHVLEDCLAVGALNIHICTAGFGETGEAVAKEIESRIRDIALKGGLRVVGPNCLGFHVPSARMQMYDNIELAQGPVAFISQSGGHAQAYVMQGPAVGIGFSKVISYGNALMMDSTDFLKYLATDPETRIVCMYLEGVRDGRRLTRLVRQLNPQKPVVIWKGGLTSVGARAADTHTGSLAGDRDVWNAFFKQTGAIRVGSIEEMADVTMTILRLKPSVGARAAILGGGGGNNVATADICTEEDVDVPTLSEETRTRLLEFVSLVNQSVVNPLDAGSVFASTLLLERALETVAADPVIDVVILHLGANWRKWFSDEAMAAFKECVSGFNRHNAAGKPVVVAVQDHGQGEEAEKLARDLREVGITVYGTLRRACRALRRFADYHKFVEETKTGV